jgi:hypothetical protein
MGPLKPGEQVDHIDGNKNNNNLSNLQAMNKRDHRGLTVKRSQHATGERVGNSKLTQKQVNEIRVFLEEGITHKEIARKYGVHLATISAISSGRTWVEGIKDIGLGSLQKVVEKETEQAYQKGLKRGEDEGYEKGFDEGYKQGRADGEENGYANGYRDGLQEGYNDTAGEDL